MAEDGRTVLRMAQELEPDIVTLDISMPQLNGIDAARKLKKPASYQADFRDDAR